MPKHGYKHTEESREKMRLAKVGSTMHENTRAAILKANLGSKRGPLSEEHKSKIAKAHVGKKLSDEHKAKVVASLIGRPKSVETRIKMSEQRKGDKSHLWRGGINPIHKAIRSSIETKFWREAVFDRDNYCCVMCLARSGNGVSVVLNADHIKPFTLFPELRFDVDNGRTLCLPCHRQTDTWGGKVLKTKREDYE